MSIQLFAGDCFDFLREHPDLKVDALIADPPYGVKFKQGNCADRLRRGVVTRFHNRLIVGDDRPFDPTPFLGYPVVILFGANNYADKLPASRGWIFWHKRPRMKPNDFGDGELIWTNQNKTIKYFEHTWNGVLRASEVGEKHYHPMQKPVALLSWLIETYTKPGDTVFDPYMGSGSTGIACVKTGRNFIGCEIDPEFYSTAEWRIQQAAEALN